jgi:hypothetical protein
MRDQKGNSIAWTLILMEEFSSKLLSIVKVAESLISPSQKLG